MATTKKASGRKPAKKTAPAKKAPANAKVDEDDDKLATSYYDKVPLTVDPARWVSTGVHSIDIALGRGLAYGKVLQLFGKSQSRKSTAAIECCRGWFANAINPVVVWFDPEGSFLDHIADYRWPDPDEPEYLVDAVSINGRSSRFDGPLIKTQVVVSPGLIYLDGEDNIDTIEDVFEKVERIANACARGGMRPLFVIDSVSRLSSRMEQSQGHKRDEMMSHAKALRKEFRLVMGPVRRANGTIIAIDHLKPTGVSGGSATGFFSSWRVQMELIHEISLATGADPVGFQTEISTVKSRWAPRMSFPLTYFYDDEQVPPDRVGVNKVDDVFFALQAAGYITGGGGGFYKFEVSPGPDTGWRGRDNWAAFYRENVEPFPGIVEKCLNTYHAHRWVSRLVRHGKDPVKRLAKYPRDVQARVNAHFVDDLGVTLKEMSKAAAAMQQETKDFDDALIKALSAEGVKNNIDNPID